MSGSRASFGLSRMHSAANDLVYQPRDFRPGSKLVVLCHGYLGTSRVFVDDPPSPNSGLFFRALAQAGFTMIGLDYGNTWGNATASARIDEVRAYAATNLGTDASSVLLVGVSMGHLTAMSYRRDNPTKVAGIVGIMPACDLTDIYSNNRASSQASIGTAWAITPPAALPAGADPNLNTGTLKGIPWAGFYSSGDTVVLPATVTAFTTAMSGVKTVCGSADHGDGIIPSVSVSAVAQQLATWGA